MILFGKVMVLVGLLGVLVGFLKCLGRVLCSSILVMLFRLLLLFIRMMKVVFFLGIRIRVVCILGMLFECLMCVVLGVLIVF